MKKLLLIVFCLLSLPRLNAQIKEEKFHSREIIIQSSDTLIRANILTGDPEDKPSPNKRYFWCSKGMINSNIGGYGGKLLNGEYLAFINNKLIEKGDFSKGLKTGIWQTWYLSGRCHKTITWKEGVLSGKYINVAENGNIESIGVYKKGKFHTTQKKTSVTATRTSSDNNVNRLPPISTTNKKSVKEVKIKKTKNIIPDIDKKKKSENET